MRPLQVATYAVWRYAWRQVYSHIGFNESTKTTISNLKFLTIAIDADIPVVIDIMVTGGHMLVYCQVRVPCVALESCVTP